MDTKQEPQAPAPYDHSVWLKRVARSAWLAAVVIAVALGIGVLGYHCIGGLGWVDALLEASMILGGMGAIAPMTDDKIKLFASAYALLSGLVVVSATSLILSPWLHRLIHHPNHVRRR